MSTERRVIRTAGGAGKWFPGSRLELGQVVDSYLDEAFIPAVKGDLIAAVSPHAGYIYSGPVAAYTFRAIKEKATELKPPDTVVVLGFSHRGEGQGVALMDGSVFSTPLGETWLDTEAADMLVAHDPRITYDYRPHYGEHSLENQVPFIQKALPSTRLVMALIAGREASLLETLADALAALADKKKILVVASSDMLHDSSYERVRKTDQATLRKAVAMDITGLMHDWDYSQQIFCGIGPVVTAMKFAQRRGCTKGTLLRYRNSGDIYPESRGQWVVGYGALAFTV